jgi:hypothetical protein
MWRGTVPLSQGLSLQDLWIKGVAPVDVFEQAEACCPSTYVKLLSIEK